jgi:hypothetical protein
VIMGPDLVAIKALKATISAIYPIKDLGDIKFYLGLTIH